MESLICRICLDKTGTISVFETEADNVQYSAKLVRLVNININQDDGLPYMMCESCTNELSMSYQFVQKCEASEKALRCLSTPIELYSDIQDDINLDIKEEDVKYEVDPHNQEENDFILTKFNIECFGEDIKNDQISSDKKTGKNIINTCDNSPNKDLDFDSSEIEKFIENDPKTCQSSKTKFRGKKTRRGRAGPAQCVICGIMTSSPSALETHMRTHTGEKPFLCATCNSRFPTKGSLKRHNETYHSVRERKFTCETCGSSFFRKNEIRNHMRVHTDERPYVCAYCSKSFRQIASRNRHQRVHTGEKPYSCPICNKKFAHKSLVQKHQSVHSDERKFNCHLCNKSVKTRTALNVHMALHTNEKQNVCSFCGMAFAMKGNLQTHIRRVHSEKSGQCTVCLKTCSDLEAHMRKHTGEKPYTCSMCNKAFELKRSLACHIMFKHESAGKFKCTIEQCPKTFPTTTMLDYHLLKQHSNHTPYVCQHCSRGFFRTSDLSRHLRVTHMDVTVKIPTTNKTIISKLVSYE